jgi:AraC-like DNA-binding protein
VYLDGCFNLIFSISENNITSIFTGQQTKSIMLPQSGKTKFIAIEFYPFGAFPFLNMPMYNFTNTVISPIDIFGNSYLNLNDKIFISSIEQCITIIEKYLIEKLSINKNDISQSKRATQLLYINQGHMRIDDLAHNVNMSKRNLERKFEITTGLSPKSLAKIFRFNKIKNELMHNPNLKLTSLAYQFHYFDQAHFINDFKQITGLTPSSFAKDVIDKKIFFNSQ